MSVLLLTGARASGAACAGGALPERGCGARVRGLGAGWGVRPAQPSPAVPGGCEQAVLARRTAAPLCRRWGSRGAERGCEGRSPRRGGGSGGCGVRGSERGAERGARARWPRSPVSVGAAAANPSRAAPAASPALGLVPPAALLEAAPSVGSGWVTRSILAAPRVPRPCSDFLWQHLRGPPRRRAGLGLRAAGGEQCRGAGAGLSSAGSCPGRLSLELAVCKVTAELWKTVCEHF